MSALTILKFQNLSAENIFSQFHFSFSILNHPLVALIDLGVLFFSTILKNRSGSLKMCTLFRCGGQIRSIMHPGNCRQYNFVFQNIFELQFGWTRNFSCSCAIFLENLRILQILRKSATGADSGQLKALMPLISPNNPQPSTFADEIALPSNVSVPTQNVSVPTQNLTIFLETTVAVVKGLIMPLNSAIMLSSLLKNPGECFGVSPYC